MSLKCRFVNCFCGSRGASSAFGRRKKAEAKKREIDPLSRCNLYSAQQGGDDGFGQENRRRRRQIFGSTGVNTPQFSDIFDLDSPPKLEIHGVTAIVLCHNEALRLEHFLEFHKSAGIDQFLVVDNASSDGSSEILENDPAVFLFPSKAKYSECKSVWREMLADLYLADRWTVFLDVDELFIHPSWPRTSIADYCQRLDNHGFDCLMTIMVDMYPEGDLAKCHYVPGTPFLDVAPMFDVGNYRMESYSRKSLSNWPTPPVHVRGGARERLFHSHVTHGGFWFDRAISHAVFGLDRSLKPTKARRLLDRLVSKWVNRADTGIGLPNMSKISIIRWPKGAKFRGGVHQMNRKMALAPDIGALLHFKYFDDFTKRVRYLAERGQHVEGGAHYKLYAQSSDRLTSTGITFAQSHRFENVNSLIRVGLMRNELGQTK